MTYVQRVSLIFNIIRGEMIVTCSWIKYLDDHSGSTAAVLLFACIWCNVLVILKFFVSFSY